MKYDFERNVIVITKEESRKASTVGTEQFAELSELMSRFTGCKVVVKNSPRKRDAFKGLTYEYMENYINAHETNRDENLATLNKLRGIGEAFVENATYGEIKNWFLMKYPEVARPNEEVAKLREDIRQYRVA